MNGPYRIAAYLGLEITHIPLILT